MSTPPSSSTTTRDSLHAAATSLCASFASHAPLPVLLAHFSSTHALSAHEHGLPQLAPFVGRTFEGRAGLEEYFGLLQKHLTYEDMVFDSWTIDASARKVSVRGSARFHWTEGAGAGQWWDERFVHMLDFDDECKITDYQVWADTGAAYLARMGRLDELRNEVAF
ncbi:hypothetical protein BDW22DRAFT_1329429 [Trametopsis cervina]|nr:hypothetical protein BDW22DRAFT_1329429 [Trametopsis cervina]